MASPDTTSQNNSYTEVDMTNSKKQYGTPTVLTGIFVLLFLGSSMLIAQKNNDLEVKSPDGAISVKVEAGAKLEWSVHDHGEQIIAPSAISLLLEEGDVLGDNAKITSSNTEKNSTVIAAINYIKANIPDDYNQLTINCKNGYGVIFRVYNDAVAYRFFTKKKGEIIIKNEEANFNFTDDHKAFLPYMWDYRGGKIFNSSFEALYREINISQFLSDSLAFLPVLVDVGNNKKVVILEADLEDYPGMYLNINQTRKGLMGVYAPYPLEAELGGFGGINYIPTKRADYIAKTSGTRSFPWRAIAISRSDKELLNNDIVQKLASPSRIADASWIKPGQVAWDWWNDWNISHVDFKAGINTPTYKYYIDFAAANKIPYIIMDGGWSEMLNLTKVVPSINLQEILDYGKQKGVGVILWASWYAISQQKDTVFPLYSKMGVKGFKIDFVDRDDQVAVASLYEIAKTAAKYHLLVDYHGVFKPTGLQRTYPNVIGYEGVKGLENYKWAIEDQPRYVTSIPYIRMIAGPMDYTPGAMRNAVKANFRPINDNPMSQGTRCSQLAMYVVFEAPLQMLSDNPTTYMKEQECTDFITSVPTTFDETVPLDGKVGEYVALARKKGDVWYVGAITNWDARNVTLDFPFLGEGTYQATVFKDGVNADRDATDYKKEVVKISSADKLTIQLSPGGGWAARIEKVK
jgi:alpha-glucosidase